ncbi:zinc-binding alcohol dehydrogenase [Halomonas vilamensis]|uniref:Zinc-binding alcohol dehydrogenase n=1 Tax=Vreelandella vilamensis TaxID=531309 RepID=A0ABU1H0Z7_9GAMM|nr:zinc-binding alcohol dehydrogenase [Halomonas vilamensis]MDR5897976.1 zinc-binding alcohol dehydrogenase [Halomonas vilamensis]
MANQYATAFWVSAPGKGELRQTPLQLSDIEAPVEVKAHYSGISRGTESLVFNGCVPASEHARMRAPFQEGDFPAPVKYGYSSVGEVVAGPAALKGKKVFCLHPHQDRYVVPASAVHELPTNIPLERAVLTANMETALNGIWDAKPLPGERISVIGAGVVGALMAYLCQRVIGTDVQLVDIDPKRQTLAEALDIPFALPGDAHPDQDLVIHASGQSEGLNTALSLAGVEGRIIEISWYGEGNVPVSLGGAFHSQRLTLRASQVGRLPTDQQPRWDFERRLMLALRLLSDPALDALISGESDFADLPHVAADIFASGSGVLCHRIRY